MVLLKMRYILTKIFLIVICLNITIFSFSYINAGEKLEKSIITITTAVKSYDFLVELAISREEKSIGLMYRQSMAADSGMLFKYNPLQIANMWMKNTYIPLDIIFIRHDGVIENIIEHTTPHSLKTISSTAKIRAVLELNAGIVAKFNIKAGDMVSHDIFNN